MDIWIHLVQKWIFDPKNGFLIQNAFFSRDLQSGLNAGKSSNSLWIFEQETQNLLKKKKNPTAQVLPVRIANQMIITESLRSQNHHIQAKKPNPIPLMLFSPNPMERNISIHQPSQMSRFHNKDVFNSFKTFSFPP